MGIWVLKHKDEGLLLPPKDDDPAGAFLAWPNEMACYEGLAYQLHQGYVNDGEWIPFQLTATALANHFFHSEPSRN